MTRARAVTAAEQKSIVRLVNPPKPDEFTPIETLIAEIRALPPDEEFTVSNRCGPIAPDEAFEILGRFVHSHFDDGREKARFSIPANPQRDDDLRMHAFVAQTKTLFEARPLADWHDDDGPVLWWTWPICEPPWVGTPNNDDWPDYHTHWTPLPSGNAIVLRGTR